MKRSFNLQLALLGLFLLTASFVQRAVSIPPVAGAPHAFVNKSWQLSAFTLDKPIDMDRDGKVDANLLAFMRPCDKDNLLTFKSDGTVASENGTLQCPNEKSAEGSTGKWSFDDSTKTLKILGLGNPYDVSEWQVIEQSDSLLKARISIFEEGSAYRATMTWTVK